ncbi:hypothetical protein ACN6KF_001470 [Labrys sp. La1]|uniref:hypothetical protein n=1 Tax=Labrys sp. La1 TaxID=3404917 RepID=UPI003EBAB90D
MFRGAPLQVFLQATNYWIGICWMKALIGWPKFSSSFWADTLGIALCAYLCAALILAWRYFRRGDRPAK